MSTPAFVRKVELIDKLLKDKQYTTAARECLILIEGGLREILINDTDKLEPSDRDRVRNEERKAAIKDKESTSDKKPKRSFENFTLGELIRVIRDAKFFEAWEKISQKSFPMLINLDKITSFRNQLFHAKGWAANREATQDEAELVFDFFKHFGRVLNIGNNPRLTDLKQQLQQSELKQPLRKKVMDYLKKLENQGIDDDAEEMLGYIDELVAGECSADDFAELWQDQQNQQSTALNYAALLEQLQHGEIALFLGSEIPDKIKKGLEQEENHDALPLTELCELIELQHGRTTLYRKVERQANALLLTENFRELAELLAKTPKPVILISVDCNSLIQEVFKQYHKPFVVFSPAIDSKHLGKFIVEYWDEPKLQVVTTEELSDLRLFERGYSLIYKIRGCFSLNNSELAITKDKDCLILSEQDYFTFARHLDRLVPDYLAGLLQTRGLWFLGHHPDNWQNRLLMKAILEKRSNSLSYAVDEQLTPFTQVYWKTSRVENYQMSLSEFVRNLQQAQTRE